MDFTIIELKQLFKYCTTDRNSTRVNTEHFKFVTKLMDKLRGKFKNLDIQDVSISLPHLEATLAEKTLLLVSKDSQNNREARRLKDDIELLTNSINAIKGNEC